MGLDITAYRNLVRAADGEGLDKYGDPGDGYVVIYANSYFRGREAPLVDGAVYRAADEWGFRAGSYGGYTVWREWLARLAGYEANDLHDGKVAATAPFAALVNFSDCEGVIGTDACKLLLAAFEEFQPVADASDNDYAREKYAEWRKAVTMAADGGCLDFH